MAITLVPDPPKALGPKPGWQTSEYWLTKLVIAIGALMEADVFAPGSMPAKIAGAVMMALAIYGYQYTRMRAKQPAATMAIGELKEAPALPVAVYRCPKCGL